MGERQVEIGEVGVGNMPFVSRALRCACVVLKLGVPALRPNGVHEH